MNTLKKILVVGSILLLPCIFFLVLIRGDNNYNRLEIFGPREAAPAASGVDTLYHTISDFSLIDQFGTEITRSRFNGKIVVSDFFFATCQTICPEMSSQLKRVQRKFMDDDDVLILSHSVNPARDTVEALLAYSKKYNAVSGKWHFVTGDKKTIYNLARNSYFITAMEGDGGPEDFIHSEQFVLLDKEGRIRGYYDGTDAYEVNRLMDEIVVLKREYEESSPQP